MVIFAKTKPSDLSWGDGRGSCTKLAISPRIASFKISYRLQS
jgi:hypothetical protein